ncbi:hypothetical protein B7486_70895 [cyanobacterium TDX16]|nr:hypothetical protein B7486_70895 [cyanobacterium TDX16]
MCLDEGGVVEQEWRGSSDPDWYENWFLSFVSQANVVYLEPLSHSAVIRKLRVEFGFPSSRDKTLVRLAISDSKDEAPVQLLTEDVDLYDPRFKKDPTMRERFMTGKRVGAVQRYLKKVHKVDVVSLALVDI